MKDKQDVQQGTLALMVLKTLDVLGPLHGYGIARRIEQISGDLLAVNQGTLYPLLLKLEQEGAIASEWGDSDNNRRARFYRLTRAGRRQLAGRDPRLGADHGARRPVRGGQSRGPPVRAVRRFLLRLVGVHRRPARRAAAARGDRGASRAADRRERAGRPASRPRRGVRRCSSSVAWKRSRSDYRRGTGPAVLRRASARTFATRCGSCGGRRSFTVTATLSLAVGIGANAAIFTLVDRVLLQALPVSDPHELVFVTDQRSRRGAKPASSPTRSTRRCATPRASNGVAARCVLPVNVVHRRAGGAALAAELVSGNYFSVLGAAMQLGRPLTRDDDRTPGAHPVVGDQRWLLAAELRRRPVRRSAAPSGSTTTRSPSWAWRQRRSPGPRSACPPTSGCRWPCSGSSDGICSPNPEPTGSR